MRLIRKSLLVMGGFTSTDFTYTGTYAWVAEGSGNWRLKFLTSGIFTPKKPVVIDAFAVGGGSGGRGGSGSTRSSGGGGGGLTTKVTNQSLIANASYNVLVGSGGVSNAAGSVSSMNKSGDNAFISAIGSPVSSHPDYGCNGGSGGAAGGNNAASTGGSNGSNGNYNGGASGYVGTGQGTTTYEFGEPTLTLYAGGGGGGGGPYSYSANGGAGGTGGGASGGNKQGGVGSSASANTGGGGGGGGANNGSNSANGGSGGSGILIIRNKRT